VAPIRRCCGTSGGITHLERQLRGDARCLDQYLLIFSCVGVSITESESWPLPLKQAALRQDTAKHRIAAGIGRLIGEERALPLIRFVQTFRTRNQSCAYLSIGLT